MQMETEKEREVDEREAYRAKTVHENGQTEECQTYGIKQLQHNKRLRT